MDKLFVECINKSENVESFLVWNLINCIKDTKYIEFTIGEIYELVFWDTMLRDYIISMPTMQLVFIKYGDNVVNLMIEYLKQSKKDYNLRNEEDKEVLKVILDNL